jgi:hypothetical protein
MSKKEDDYYDKKIDNELKKKSLKKSTELIFLSSVNFLRKWKISG